MMRSSLIVSTHFIRPVALMCFCTLAMFGCSSSSSENTSTGTGVADTQSESAISSGSEVQPPSNVQEPSNAQVPAPVQTPSETQAPSPSNTTTRVTFDITVPAYMSNELQVRLESGDINTTAAFVLDESWSASATFPVNTTNPLVVTFADGNGAITLGTVDTSFTTAADVSQTVQVTAGQFDTTRWDSDSDGVSNLDELIAGTNPSGGDVIQPVQASLELVPDKTFRINWQPSTNANFYRVLENPDGVSGFSPVSENLAVNTQFFDHRVALFNRVNARYIVQACNADECVDSEPLMVTGALNNAIGYFKASNTGGGDNFGFSVALSADGNTLAVGAERDDSGATGVNGNQADGSAPASGAVYVFVRNPEGWQQQAYLKASAADVLDLFGVTVSLSADGNTLAVGAPWEDSAASGVDGDPTDNSALESGAVYVFTRSNEIWQQQAYLKASNAASNDRFGSSIALSADGNTLSVGAIGEDGGQTGINGEQDINPLAASGAVYVFFRSNGLWQQQAYIKASNAGVSDSFGSSVALSANGNTLAVGALSEDGAATGVNGVQTDGAVASGAVYIFARSNGFWQQMAYLKASNTDEGDRFGFAVSLSADGNTLAIGAVSEDSSSTGVNGDQTDNLVRDSGAVYVFTQSNSIWQQQAYLKSSNSGGGFGGAVSLSADGNTLAASAIGERSSAIGINGDEADDSAVQSGAVYTFGRSSGVWRQLAYLKASNTDAIDGFGRSVSLSADGNTLAVGANAEDSAATGINGDLTDNSIVDSGAVYLY